MVHVTIPEYIALIALALCAGWLAHKAWEELR